MKIKKIGASLLVMAILAVGGTTAFAVGNEENEMVKSIAAIIKLDANTEKPECAEDMNVEFIDCTSSIAAVATLPADGEMVAESSGKVKMVKTILLNPVAQAETTK